MTHIFLTAGGLHAAWPFYRRSDGVSAHCAVRMYDYYYYYSITITIIDNITDGRIYVDIWRVDIFVCVCLYCKSTQKTRRLSLTMIVKSALQTSLGYFSRVYKFNFIT